MKQGPNVSPLTVVVTLLIVALVVAGVCYYFLTKRSSGASAPPAPAGKKAFMPGKIMKEKGLLPGGAPSGEVPATPAPGGQ